MMTDSEYWEKRYKQKETGWDLGTISPPLKAYIDQLQNKEVKILIPGAGNSYEAEYLYLNGFSNVDVLDIATAPFQNLQQRIPQFPEENLKQHDFFKYEGAYDFILEQTFFCALPVKKRPLYVEKAFKLLKPGGKVAGLLFNIEFPQAGPPFGGTKKEYKELFRKRFLIQKLEPCINSVSPRQGTELFFIFKKI